MSIVEIARKFKVSPVTVSNALNRRKGVAQNLAEDIRTYARQVGYQPNYLARSLLSGRTGVIGLCLCLPPSTPWYGELLSQLQHQLALEHYHLNTIVIDPFDDADRYRSECRALNFFRQIKAEAVLLGPADAEGFQQLHRELGPIEQLVVFDALDTLPVPHLRLDIAGGTRMALDYLYAQGHRRIGYLGLNRFDAANPSPNTRYANYRHFLAAHDLELRPEWLIPTPASVPVPAMCETIAAHLRSAERPTALFCHDDNYAALALKVANQCGLRVPDELSLIGFDDQPAAWLAHPGITTIKFDQDSYVHHLVEFTLDCANRVTPEPNRCYLEPATLVVRNSVKPLV